MRGCVARSLVAELLRLPQQSLRTNSYTGAPWTYTGRPFFVSATHTRLSRHPEHAGRDA
jgi:hypothetical protein